MGSKATVKGLLAFWGGEGPGVLVSLTTLPPEPQRAGPGAATWGLGLPGAQASWGGPSAAACQVIVFAGSSSAPLAQRTPGGAASGGAERDRVPPPC